jgi:hypothetical protein
MYRNEDKTRVREALARRTGLGLTTIRHDEEALNGDYRGHELALYNFNKGRGGIYFCIDLRLQGTPGVALLVRSGLTGDLSRRVEDRTGRPESRDFAHNFLVQGEPEEAVLRVLQTATVQETLAAARERTEGIEVRTEDGHLVYEQLDYGKHDADYLLGLMDMLARLADALDAA